MLFKAFRPQNYKNKKVTASQDIVIRPFYSFRFPRWTLFSWPAISSYHRTKRPFAQPGAPLSAKIHWGITLAL
jgi:hypothetical protein